VYQSDLAGVVEADEAWPTTPTFEWLEPQALPREARRWYHWLGPAISGLILAAVLFQVDRFDLHGVWKAIPSAPAFWLFFVAYYLAGPISEWIIFRRLWSLPTSGLPILLQKYVGNEIVLGYLGEAYFYGWARSKLTLTAAPFGAVKDVAILSAISGNLMALAMLGIAWPFLGSLQIGLYGQTAIMSVAALSLTSLIAMAFRRQLFSLPRNDLSFILKMHLARITMATVCMALMWHAALPQVAVGLWLALGALRLLVSRLPLVPNKDLVFAGLYVFMAGSAASQTNMLAIIASLILAMHLLVGSGLGVAQLLSLGASR
jgi:hypothetical protein